ncbi:MAG: hypothetical protein J6Y26_02595 [Lachnospiraceae bacterium]|nr:hypothetical protein [Lachnospiraceae bacterium]
MAHHTTSILKKITALLLCACMLTSLAACGKNGGNGDSEPTQQVSVTPSEAETTPTAEATPSENVTPGAEATPTQAATPTLTVAPTESITPAAETPTPGEEDLTPTPQITATPVVRDGENYKITTTAYNVEEDVRRQSEIVVEDKSGKIVFKASEYAAAHRSGWEAVALSRIMELTKHIGDAKRREISRTGEWGCEYDIFMDEVLIKTIDLGAQGRLGVYAHAVLYIEECSETTLLVGSYIVSCRLINEDMSQQYVVLYEKSTEDLDEYGIELLVDFYYANEDGPADKYDPEHTKRVMASATYSSKGDDYCKSKFYGHGYYDEKELMTDELFTVGTYLWNENDGIVLTDEMLDGDGVVRYSKKAYDWQILSYRLSDLVNALYHYQNGETTAIPDFAKHVQNGVFSVTEPFVTHSFYADYTVRAEISLKDNEVTGRLYFIDDKREVLIDQFEKPAYELLKNDAGETLQVSAILTAEAYNEFEPYHEPYPEMTLRYTPAGATKPGTVFESATYLADNKAKFEKAAAEYEKTLRNAYKGDIVVKKNLLKEISLGSFGFVAIYEIAAYGETPKQIGDVNSLYRYQVSCVWVGEKGQVRESFIYEKETEDGEAPKGCGDYLNIRHTIMEHADVDKLAAGEYLWEAKEAAKNSGNLTEKDIFTVIALGREKYGTTEFFGDFFQYVYDEEFHHNAMYVDANGDCLAMCYSTYHESTDGYGMDGGEMKDASGKVYYSQEKNDVKLMSCTMRQVVAAFLERGANFGDARVSEKAPKELVDKVIVDTTDSDYTPCVWSETAAIGKNTQLLCVVHVHDLYKWYTLEMYLVRDGKVIRIVNEECMPGQDLEDPQDN